nr:protein trapped in endoderm-1-like [Procambarus clarkii]
MAVSEILAMIPAITSSDATSLFISTSSQATSLNTSTSSEVNSRYTPGVLLFTAICNILTCAVGTVANVMVVVVTLSCKKLRSNHQTAFVVNLTICLIPMCSFTLPLMVARVIEIYMRSKNIPEMLLWVAFTSHVLLHQIHMHTICAMAVNRVVALRSPVFFKRMLRSSVVALQLVLIWVLSVILWLPLTLIRDKFDLDRLRIAMDSLGLMKLYIALNYFLPLSITIICYLLIFFKVRYGIAERDGGRPKWEQEVSRSIFIIFIILVVCSLPHTIIHLVDCECAQAWVLIHTLLFVQFCLDPIVYVVVSSEYRKSFVRCLGRSHTSRDEQMMFTSNPSVS